MFLRCSRRLLLAKNNSVGSATNPAAERLSEDAQRSQRVWDSLVPERNIGITHPMFAVLLVLTVSLHLYNNKQDELKEAELRKARLAKQVIPDR